VDPARLEAKLTSLSLRHFLLANFSMIFFLWLKGNTPHQKTFPLSSRMAVNRTHVCREAILSF
jgi:hypothetical protein